MNHYYYIIKEDRFSQGLNNIIKSPPYSYVKLGCKSKLPRDYTVTPYPTSMLLLLNLKNEMSPGAACLSPPHFTL